MRSIFYSGHSAGIFNRRLIIIILIFVTTILFRIPFLGEPLDRDSAEFASRGYFWAHGYMLYKDMLSNRPPGIDLLFLILFKFFQPTNITVNLFIICWAILNTILIYLLAKILFNNFLVSCAAITLYAFFSSSPFIEGTGAMTEHFMVTFNMLGFYFLIKAGKREKIWLFLMSGLFFGIAFLFKQVAIFDFFAVLIYLFFYILIEKRKMSLFFKKAFIITAALLLPFAICSLYFKYKGILNDFIFNVFVFNLHYIRLLGYSTGNFWGKFIYFNSRIFITNSIIWVGAISYISLLLIEFFISKTRRKEIFSESKDRFILALWGIFSFIGLCSSTRFFPHYYIAIIPSFVLMTAYTLRHLWMAINKRIWHIFLFIFLIYFISLCIYFHYDYYLKFSPEEISMHKYGWEPFVEAKEVGLYIRKHTTPQERICVWAEEPEIYFYSLRSPVCKYWSDNPFIYFHEIYKDAEDILLSSLNKTKAIYLILDTRHLKILENYIRINEFFRKYYKLEKEFKVIRNGVWGYSLLVCRLKGQ